MKHETDSKRILIVLPTLSGGGAERVMVVLANEFSTKGFDVELLVVDHANAAYQSEVVEEVCLTFLREKRVIFAIPKLIRTFLNRSNATVYTTLGYFSILVIFSNLLCLNKHRVVVREAISPLYDQVQLSPWKRRIYQILVKMAYRKASHVVALCEEMASTLRDLYGLDNIAVIPNPIDAAKLESLATSPIPLQPPWSSSDSFILAVGSLSLQKDFELLIRAYAAADLDPSVKLIVLGEGGQRSRLEKLAKDLNCEDGLWMPGFVSNPYPYMKQCSVFVLSSRYEGFPNVLIQALATGAYCIAARCPSGPTEILEGSEQGVLFEVGNTEQLAAALSAAINDGLSGRISGGEKAKLTQLAVEDKYDLDKIAGSYLQLRY